MSTQTHEVTKNQNENHDPSEFTEFIASSAITQKQIFEYMYP